MGFLVFKVAGTILMDHKAQKDFLVVALGI
jgi:hypothetical protein